MALNPDFIPLTNQEAARWSYLLDTTGNPVSVANYPGKVNVLVGYQLNGVDLAFGALASGTTGTAGSPIVLGTAATITSPTLAGTIAGTPTWASPQPMPGVANASSAAAGQVGEVIAATLASPGIAMTSGTTMTIVSLALTAGDWDVAGEFNTLPAAGTTQQSMIIGLGSSATTLPAAYANVSIPFTAVIGFSVGAPIGPARVSLAAPGSVFLILNPGFTGGTATVYGFAYARRAR